MSWREEKDREKEKERKNERERKRAREKVPQTFQHSETEAEMNITNK